MNVVRLRALLAFALSGLVGFVSLRTQLKAALTQTSPDPAAILIASYKALRPSLPSTGQIAFLSFDTQDSSRLARRYLAQFSLAPLVVVPADPEKCSHATEQSGCLADGVDVLIAEMPGAEAAAEFARRSGLDLRLESGGVSVMVRRKR